MFNPFKKKEKSTFRFSEPENTACFTCNHVLSDHSPILYVSHSAEDGAWQFMCGQNDHTEANAKIVSLKQITQIDPSINDLFKMPLGVGAERDNFGEKWRPFKL